MARRISACVIVAWCLVVGGCSGASSPPASSPRASQSASGQSASGEPASSAIVRTSAVAVGSSQQVAVKAAELTAQQVSALKQGWAENVSLSVGVPIQITSDKPLPAGGIQLSRTYQQPLPEGVAATMAYYDDVLGAWHAVPSALSPDRRTVTAVVHHVSLWTDFTGAIGTQVQGASTFGESAADWAYNQVGKVFDTHVGPPSCVGQPSWLKSKVFIQTTRGNPLLFCVGSDPKNAAVLDVKVRVNRGFAYSAHLGSATAWTDNSTSLSPSIDEAIAAVGHVDQPASKTWAAFSPKGSIVVGAGQELSFGATEQQIRAMGTGSTVLRLSPPSTLSFLVSTLGQLVGTRMPTTADGYATAAVTVAGCLSEVNAAHDAATWARAAQTCVGNLDGEATARLVALYLTKRGVDPVKAGKEAADLVGRASIYLALIGPVFSSMNFIGERTLADSARTVNVYPTVAQVNASTLRSAYVPADCRLPAQRLRNNSTTRGGPGSGWLVNTVGYADFAGLGYKQALTAYECTAGGVSWPEDLVLIGAGGKLLASLNLGSFVKAEHSDLTSVSTSGNTARITWDTYEGAGFYDVYQSATVSYASGHLVLSNHGVTYTPEAVTSAILNAQYAKKRSSLLDPAVVTDAQWQQLTTTYAAFIFTNDGTPGACTRSRSMATCAFSGVASGGTQATGSMVLQKAPGTRYGWRVADLQIHR